VAYPVIFSGRGQATKNKFMHGTKN